MSDDNNFSLGDILWEYADYTPPELALIGVPYVCCSYTNSFGSLREEEYASVSIDDYQTAYRAVSTLLDLGHRRIAALVPSCTDRSISQLRYKGYLEALDFTAVFTLSDTMAIAAMKALNDHGRKVPDDCSVIAIDGLSISEYTIPTLTTMVQPSEEMARESVHILLDMLKNGAKPRHMRMDAHLREGGSVRQLREK